jgi:5-methylcytosine-specific restriction protein B
MRSPHPVAEGVEAATNQAGEARARRAWLHPLPGGAERYKRTLDALLAWIDRERPQASALGAALGRERRARACLSLLEATGLGRREGAVVELTEAGRAYAADPDPEHLFERLHATYLGLLETLVLADTWGLDGPSARRRLFDALLGRGVERAPRAPVVAASRRRWLRSLGLLEPTGAAPALTPLGRQVLGAHGAEVTEIRKRIEDLLEDERDADLAVAEAMEDLHDDDEVVTTGTPPPNPRLGAGASPPTGPSPLPPPPRSGERIDLTAASLRPHLAHLDLPDSLIERIGAALSSGKHLLLVGPPGTGKTDLALGLGAAAEAEGYSRGMLTVTASADWTTYETIGGYALERDGALRFRAGVFLRALEQEQWLLVDELNRADVDRALGELFTVLSGRGAATPFQLADGRAVTIGVDAHATHRVPPSFRLVATMNTWDRGALFRLSYALRRRFAIVHVGPPDDGGYARLLDHHARHASASGDPPLDPGSHAALGRLFHSSGLLAHCPVGPAIALDMIRYARRRAAPGEGLAEAAAMYLLPQLEGLVGEAAAAAADVLDAELGRTASPKARDELRARLRELSPEWSRGGDRSQGGG